MERTMSEDEARVVRALRDRGFLVMVWSPDDLSGTDTRVVEEQIGSSAWEVISDARRMEASRLNAAVPMKATRAEAAEQVFEKFNFFGAEVEGTGGWENIGPLWSRAVFLQRRVTLEVRFEKGVAVARAWDQEGRAVGALDCVILDPEAWKVVDAQLIGDGSQMHGAGRYRVAVPRDMSEEAAGARVCAFLEERVLGSVLFGCGPLRAAVEIGGSLVMAYPRDDLGEPCVLLSRPEQIEAGVIGC